MKLLTFRTDDQPGVDRVGVMLDDETLVDIHLAHALSTGAASEESLRQARAELGADLRAILAGGEAALERLDSLVERGRQGQWEQASLTTGEITFLPPIPRPGKIIAMGRNFSDHLAESTKGLAETFDREVKPPEIPMGFIKASSSVVGHLEPVIYPKVTRQLDYEVEMAIVIGKPGRYIENPDEALEHVAGYAVFNDISARDLQLREMKTGPLLLGKSLDTCGPFGPYLVTRDEVGDASDLGIRLRVNGETRQSGTMRQLIWNIPELVCYWSAMTLEVGDVITTGTPEGVALWRKPDPEPWFLKPGDVVEAEIDRVGLLRNPIVSAD